MRLAWEQRPVETETALEGSTREVPSLSSLLWGPFTGLKASVAALWQALCTCGLLSPPLPYLCNVRRSHGLPHMELRSNERVPLNPPPKHVDLRTSSTPLGTELSAFAEIKLDPTKQTLIKHRNVNLCDHVQKPRKRRKSCLKLIGLPRMSHARRSAHQNRKARYVPHSGDRTST